MYILCVLLDFGKNWYKKSGHKLCGGMGKDIIFLWV
jgi:hypothetical protein